MMALFLTGITAIAQIDRSQIPTSGPEPEIPLVEPERFSFKNGMEVLVVEDDKFPTVTFSLRLDNPPVLEGDKVGVASLASALLGKGTQKTSKEAFTEEVDFLGARISMSPNGGFAYGLKRYKERIVELMAEAAFMPKFTQEELDFEKEQLIEGIKSGANSAAAIAGTVRNALAYGKNHPNGEFATEESINAVTLEDVQKYYEDQFKPENAYMVVSGDITAKEAKKLLKKYFKKWEKGTAPTYNYPEISDVPATEINFVNVPNAVQTELAIMNLSDLKMDSEDYFPALVANYIYGGAFGSYLNMNLREANGYTYGARSSLGAGDKLKSTFRATTKIRNEVTDSAIVETLSELQRIRDTYVDDEMLSNAKAKFLGDFIMSSENTETMANRMITIATRNLPADFYTNYISNINAVTKEDVKRIANKYMKLDNLRIVVVGKASDILEPVENMTFNGQKFPVKFYDKYANPTDRPSTIAIPAGTTVATVLNKYVEAIGGKSAVEGVNTISYDAVLSTPMGDVILTEKRAKDNKWRMTVSMAGNAMSDQIYADGKGKIVAQGRTIVPEGEMADALANEARFIPELNAVSNAELVGAEEMGEKTVYVVKWSDGLKTYYDMETGLMVAKATTMKQGDQEIEQVLRYSDYQAVNGVKFPMTLTQTMMGREMDFKVKEVKVNSEVTDADFQ